MVIAVRGVALGTQTTATSTTYVMTVPAGTVNGSDFLVAVLTGQNATVPPAQTGWTTWTTHTTTGLGVSIYSRPAAAEPASYTFTGLTSARYTGFVIAFSGVDLTTPSDVTPTKSAGGTTAQAFAAISPVTAGAWVLSVPVLTEAVTSTTWTAGNTTIDASRNSAATGSLVNAFGALGHVERAAAGAFTPTGPTASGTKTRTIQVSLALRPSTGGAAAPPNEGTATGTWNFDSTAVGAAPPDPVTAELYTDDFNRANGALGGNWATAGTGPPTIASNAVVGGSAIAGVRWVTPTESATSQFSEFTHLGGSFHGPSVAMPGFGAGSALADAGQWYTFRSQGTTAGVAITLKPTGGTTHTVLASSATNLTVGDVMRLEYDGATLTAYLNGAVLLTHTPTAPITGQRYVGFSHGSASQVGTALLDDWSGGTIPVPAGGHPFGLLFLLTRSTEPTPTIGPSEGAATGTWAYAGAAVGRKTPRGSSSGTFKYVGTAVGRKAPRGATSGTWTYTATAVGTAPAVGAAVGATTGVWAYTGTAAGLTTRRGTATGTATYTGTATGRRTPRGSTGGTFTYTGTAVGRKTPRGTATGTYAYNGVAVGTAPLPGVKAGTALGAWTYQGAAVGRRAPRATATGTFTYAGAAVGRTTHRGTATGTFTFTGAATGKRVARGTSSGTYTYTGTAAGRKTPRGATTGTWGYASNAVGTAPIPGVKTGAAAGAWTYQGTATGRTTRRGTAVGVLAYRGVATGRKPQRGAAAGAWAYTGAAVGKRTPRAAAVGAWLYVGTAGGTRAATGIAVGVYTWTGAAVGTPTLRPPAFVPPEQTLTPPWEDRTLTPPWEDRTLTPPAEARVLTPA